MKTTIAERFFNDARVLKAQADLAALLAEYSRQLTGPKSPDAELNPAYENELKAFAHLRGGALFFPYFGSGLGNGALVELDDGSVKYDFINGIGVHHFGHSHPKIAAACLQAALSDTVMQGNLQQNAESLRFGELLLDAAKAKGAKLAHCFITSTGVMAGENALKIAFQKKHPAKRLLAFEGCFMGRTLAMSQFTDKAAYREGLPINYQIDYVPFFDYRRPKESTDAALAVLRKHLHRYPKEYAAMSFELILGEGGFYPAEREFHAALMDELKKYDVAVLVDEVQTFARTSELFAFQHFGLDAYVDAVWVGKASQACATLFSEEFKPRAGLLSQTYTASTAAIAAGRAIVDELVNGGYFGAYGRIMRLHAHFKERLEAIAKRHPDKMSGPYGVGAMVGFTPLGGVAEKVTKFVHKLFDNGVMGFTAGAGPARARFLLPVGAVTEADIDAVAAIVEKTLGES